MKKVVSLVLAFILTFSLFVPAASAADANAKAYPVVYVKGYGADIVAEKGNLNSETYYPTGADIGAIVKEALVPCLMELALGVSTNNYDKYCDELYNAIAPVYENVALAPDGTARGKSGQRYLSSGRLEQFERFSGGVVDFCYDWRLSPETAAEELDTYINWVLSKTGAKKVNVIGRCLGGNIVSAYLQNFGEEAKAKINKAVLFVPSTEGINMIGALFSGNLEIAADNIDEFAEEFFKYQDMIEDPMIRDLITLMLTLFEQANVLGVSVDSLQYFLDAIKDNLIPRLVRRSYGSFVSFWSMVPDKYFEDAIEYVYNTPELKEEYAGTIEKARSYHDNVMVNARTTTSEMAKFIDISVISKYNIPAVPVFTACNQTTDGTAETYLTSFGATTADFGKTLTADYISAMSEESKKYLSADEKIDASTCVLPDKTWFIKNNYHDHFPASIDRLIETIFSTEDMTVFTDAEYPQYLDAEVTAETLTPVTEKDPVTPEKGSTEAYYALLIKVIKVAVALIIKLVDFLSTKF